MDEIKGAPGIVSLFGHNTIAGYVSADTMFGDPMVRVDVPETTKFPEFTRHYGVKAVYEIDWCSEELMRAAAESAQVRPINVYVPQLMLREEHEKMMDEMRAQIDRQIDRLLDRLPEPDPRGYPDGTELDGDEDDDVDGEEE